MRIIVSCKSTIKEELESTKGEPNGAILMANGKWIWSFGPTFLVYVLKDQPIKVFGRLELPFLVKRHIVITEIYTL